MTFAKLQVAFAVYAAEELGESQLDASVQELASELAMSTLRTVRDLRALLEAPRRGEGRRRAA